MFDQFGTIGFLLFLAFLVFGPKKLPEIARALGKGMAELRRASAELKSQLEEEITNLDNPVREIREELSNLENPARELKTDLEDEIRDLDRSVQSEPEPPQSYEHHDPEPAPEEAKPRT